VIAFGEYTHIVPPRSVRGCRIGEGGVVVGQALGLHSGCRLAALPLNIATRSERTRRALCAVAGVGHRH
jgi:hypothetical protein